MIINTKVMHPYVVEVLVFGHLRGKKVVETNGRRLRLYGPVLATFIHLLTLLYILYLQHPYGMNAQPCINVLMQ